MKNVLFTIGFSIALLGQGLSAESSCGSCQQHKKDNNQKLMVSDTESNNDQKDSNFELLLADSDEENCDGDKDASMFAAYSFDDEEHEMNYQDEKTELLVAESDDENKAEFLARLTEDHSVECKETPSTRDDAYFASNDDEIQNLFACDASDDQKKSELLS